MEPCAQGMDELQSMKNTNQYTVLNVDSSSRTMQIDLYDLQSNSIRIIYRGLIVIRLTGGKMILINSNQIFILYRDYYLYNITKELTKLFDFQVQEPTFSPNGKKIAYAKENNLYDLAAKSTTQITTDGKKNAIINGITDGFMKKNLLL
jgi:dipeptidyl-peptidase-4